MLLSYIYPTKMAHNSYYLWSYMYICYMVEQVCAEREHSDWLHAERSKLSYTDRSDGSLALHSTFETKDGFYFQGQESH